MNSPVILKDATILIVDDEKANVRLLEIILAHAGYTNVHGTTDSRQAVPLFLSLKPDILLLDLSMPNVDGFDVMGRLQPFILDHPVPILVLTADATTAIKHRALAEGAQDFLTKPLDHVEVLLRIDNLLRAQNYALTLECEVRDRTSDLIEAQEETLQRLAIAAEYRDDETGQHTRRVGHTSASIAEAMKLSANFVESIRQAAPLHDVGKIGISDTILLKPGKLTTEEFEVMKTHTVIGAKILSGGSSPPIKLAEEIALYHHERWNGRGYSGLVGDQIPLSGRIVSVADVFDALTHRRPYKEPWPVSLAVAEIESNSGSQFDPAVVAAFMTLPHKDLLST
ncbi:response regulator [soil metagenome]